MSVAPLSPLAALGVFKCESFAGTNYFWDSMKTFCDIELPDCFPTDDTILTAASIAASKGWHPERLYRLLRHLAFANVVKVATEAPEGENPVTAAGFQLTPDGTLFRSTHPSHLRSLLLWEHSPCMRYATAQRAAIIKNPADEYIPGAGLYMINEKSKENDLFLFLKSPGYEDQGKLFDGAMTAYSYAEANCVTDSKELASFHTIIDVGGNMGTLLSMVISRCPAITKGVVADLPPVIAAARAKNEPAAYGVTEKVTFTDLNFFEPASVTSLMQHAASAISSGQKWCITMKHILHDWSDVKAVEILTNLRAAVTAVPGAKELLTLSIIEHHFFSGTGVSIPAAESTEWYTSGFDMHMLSAAGGKQRTKYDWDGIFGRSGWSWKRIVPCKGTVSIVEATIA